jgi:transposase
MSLHPCTIEPIPVQTASICRSAFPKGNLMMQLRDEVGSLYEDEQFRDCFSTQGQPGWSPWRLALITVMQYLEDLTDRQAANAVCGRMDWKYALSLNLDDPGVDASVLSEFRSRLVKGQAEASLLERLLVVCETRGWLSAGGHQRTDSTHVQGALRRLHRLEVIGETLRAALNSLAVAVPDWLALVVGEDWYERYSVRVEDYRFPQAAAAQKDLALLMGEDGHHLFAQIELDEACGWLRQLPSVEALRQVWVQQFQRDAAGGLQLRSRADSPPSGTLIHSPYEVEARFSRKRQTDWVGYKVHLTETCDPHLPHLIVQVSTTTATTPDGTMTTPIHQSLTQQGRAPAVHLVDTAYIDTDLLISSAEDYGIELLGPVLPDSSWQALDPNGLDATHFQIDWPQQQVICPAGKTAQSWKPFQDKDAPMVAVQFAYADCRDCALKPRCTRAQKHGRVVTLKPQKQYEALVKARQVQQSQPFKQRYAMRSGIEGTISQAVAFGLRQCRYRGLPKSHLQHIITAVAMNVVRIVNWLNHKPFAKTRISHFARLTQPTESPIAC